MSTPVALPETRPGRGAPASLIDRYNVPGPRYTSYPSVPFWQAEGFSAEAWARHSRQCFLDSNETDGTSVYIHLPFCETPCTFCGCVKKLTRDHGVEAPYIRDVMREWSLYLDHLGAPPLLKELHLGGGTPTFFSPSHLAELMDAVLGGARVAPRFDFSFEGNPSSTTEEHLRVLHDYGFRRVSLGVQDFDPVVQKTINRVQSFDDVSRATATARELGYTSINYDLIYGLPRQRLAGIVDTIGKVLTLRPNRIAFYGYAHVPWKPEATQRRFSEADIPRGRAKRALYEAGRDRLLEAGYREIGMDHFAVEGDALLESARAGTLHRNFMGYTPMHTRLCIGLGMSAIGDAGSAFAQNEKSLSAYHERVEAGCLPVYRGHCLTEEDRVLRRVILDLMCRHETRLSADFQALDCAGECEARLAPLIDDGLVTRRGDRLTVTATGSAFVRNVCMAFDARLWRDRPGTRLFSDTV